MTPFGPQRPPCIVGTIETPLGPRPFLLHTRDALLELDRFEASCEAIPPALARASGLASRSKRLAEMSVQDPVWREHVGRFCCRRCSSWIGADEASTWRDGVCDRRAALRCAADGAADGAPRRLLSSHRSTPEETRER